MSLFLPLSIYLLLFIDPFIFLVRESIERTVAPPLVPTAMRVFTARAKPTRSLSLAECFKPLSHFAGYFPDCYGRDEFSNREQSETNWNKKCNV